MHILQTFTVLFIDYDTLSPILQDQRIFLGPPSEQSPFTIRD